MASTLLLILDESATNFTYGPQNWTFAWNPFYFGETFAYPGPPVYANTSILASFEVYFEGTSPCSNLFKHPQRFNLQGHQFLSPAEHQMLAPCPR